jgi:hypothetical protein
MICNHENALNYSKPTGHSSYLSNHNAKEILSRAQLGPVKFNEIKHRKKRRKQDKIPSEVK